MIEAFTLQTTISLLTLVSLTIGVIYHIMTLNNTRKNQEIQIETRQAQLFMQIYEAYASEETMKMYFELLHFEWDDLADFERKYGSGDNVELAAKREAHWAWYDGMGVLLRRKLIDPDVVFDTLGHGGVIHMWTKFESIIKAQREHFKIPHRFNGFEYLAEEMMKLAKQRGLEVQVSDTFDRYVDHT
jgi:hypothetical protein